ncbi:hypothetical protein RKE29_26535 [Streptomyces sp. B1866]|nr:hypothetical protein [Streptomyces sp. B1866]MDT3400136.1 hypothetical protein [Streptomyces sp. B1866]
MYTTANGFLHAAALAGSAGVTAVEFAELALGWFLLSAVTPLLMAEAPGIDQGRYPGEAASLEAHLTELDHILRTSVEQGVDAGPPRQARARVERAVAAGHGADGYGALIELLRRPSEEPSPLP